MSTDNSKKQRKAGRKPKLDPAIFRYGVKLNAVENTQFLGRFDMSLMKTKACFIKSCILDRPVKVIKIDKSMSDYVMKLTQFYSQFRAIGVNYNQVVTTLKTNFSEKKALAFLYKLEQITIELVGLNTQIAELTKRFEEKWLQK